MGASFGILKNDINEFQDVIRNLSAGINSSGLAWRDSQYEQLAGKVSTIAASSKGVIMAAQRCEAAMDRFDKIAAEV